MPITIKRIIKIVITFAISMMSVMLILNTNPSPHSIGIVIGLIGLLTALDSDVIESIKIADSLRKDFKLIEVQNAILKEVTTSNTKVLSLITSQAELLSKMTSIAVKKTSEPHSGSPN